MLIKKSKGCLEHRNLVESYLKRELTGALLDSFSGHLTDCMACREAVSFARSLQCLSTKSAPFRPSNRLADRIKDSLQSQNVQQLSEWKWTTFGLGGFAATAIVLFFMLANPILPSKRNQLSSNLIPVTFRLKLPSATDVSLVGDFNSWDPAATRLVREGDTWTVELMLNSGQYQYMFVVDGAQWISDPNARQVEDGYGRKNALISI